MGVCMYGSGLWTSTVPEALCVYSTKPVSCFYLVGGNGRTLPCVIGLSSMLCQRNGDAQIYGGWLYCFWILFV